MTTPWNGRTLPGSTQTLYNADIPYDSDIPYSGVVVVGTAWNGRQIPYTQYTWDTATMTWDEATFTWDTAFDYTTKWNGRIIP